MNTEAQLREQLNRINRRSYPAYKDLEEVISFRDTFCILTMCREIRFQFHLK